MGEYVKMQKYISNYTSLPPLVALLKGQVGASPSIWTQWPPVGVSIYIICMYVLLVPRSFHAACKQKAGSITSGLVVKGEQTK